MAYATGNQAGTLKQTVANVRETVKNIFKKKNQSATINLDSGTVNQGNTGTTNNTGSSGGGVYVSVGGTGTSGVSSHRGSSINDNLPTSNLITPTSGATTNQVSTIEINPIVKDNTNLRNNKLAEAKRNSYNQLQNILKQNSVKDLEIGSGKLRDYQFEAQLKNNLDKYTASKTQEYQELVNKGMNVDVANIELNKDLSNYQKQAYQSEGYDVIETNDGLQLSREVKPNTSIIQYDLFGRAYIKPSEAPSYKDVFPKKKVLKEFAGRNANKSNPDWYNKYNEKNMNINPQNASLPLSYQLASVIEKSKIGKSFLEKNPFFKTGEIKGEFEVTYQNPFKTEQTTSSFEYVKNKINVQKTNRLFSDLGKGVFFSPAMASGVEGVLEVPTQEVGYEYVTINGIRYRKNLITGKIEKEIPVFDIVSPKSDSYKAKFGNREYLVTKEGRIFPIKKPKIETKDLNVVYNLGSINKPINPFESITSSPFNNIGEGSTTAFSGAGIGAGSIPKIDVVSARIPNPSITGNTIEINVNRISSNIKGSSELTSMFKSTNTNELINLKSSNKNELSLIDLTSVTLKTKVENKSSNRHSNILGTPQSNVQLQPQENLSLQKEISKQAVINLSMQSLISKLKINQLEKDFSKLKNTEINKIKVPKEYIFKIESGKVPIAKELSSKEEDLFKVYGRRYGKFSELGSASSEKEEEKLAKEFSLGSLGVSTFIEKGGKKIEFNLGSGFTKSKNNQFIQVQERKGRLSSYGEKSEIKRSRKRKGFI
jgi:hypothetical protein